MSRKRTWTDESFIEAVGLVYSVSGVLKRLGLHPTGANYKTVWDSVGRLRLDVSHWTGSGHLKGKTHNWRKKIPLDLVLVEESEYRGSTSSLKYRLLKDGLLENKCYVCGRGPEWESQSLVMVLDHINGRNKDHQIKNLRLLCPNCNSQQTTFAGRNKRIVRIKKEKFSCSRCGKLLTQKRRTGMCISCCKKENHDS